MTLNCAERGYMLIQIRDEINMTIDAYQDLYESTIAYGIRKTLLVKIICFIIFVYFIFEVEDTPLSEEINLFIRTCFYQTAK